MRYDRPFCSFAHYIALMVIGGSRDQLNFAVGADYSERFLVILLIDSGMDGDAVELQLSLVLCINPIAYATGMQER